MRKAAIIFFILLSFSSIQAQHITRPKVAVVLSGGGAKGFAHIGVLQVLEKEGIPIDMIVGTSMGSIIGGLYSIGYTTDQLQTMCLTENWPHLLSDYISRKQLDQYSQEEQQRYIISMPFNPKNPGLSSGMVKGQNVINLFCGLAANIPAKADFRKFPIEFACVGTDLISGKEKVLNSGFLPTSIFSSMAIPGVFAPLKTKNYLFVDGGVLNNFPTDIAKKMGADIIIGVNLNNDFHKDDNINTMKDLTNQIAGILIFDKDSVRNKLCDVLIEPNMNGYGSSSFSNVAADTLIHRGQQSAMAVVDQIRRLKTKYNLQPRTISDSLTTVKKWKITDITFSGHYSLPENLLLNTINLTPGEYDYDEIKKSINALYGMGVFDRVYFSLDSNPTGKTLNITLDENQSFNLNVGMRLNTRSAVSIILNATRKDYSKDISLLSATADISTNPRFNFLAEINKQHLPRLAFMLEGTYKDFRVFLNKDYSYSAEIYFGSAKLYTYKRLFKYSVLGAGVNQEYYIGKLYNAVSDANQSLTTKNQFVLNYYGYYGFDNLDNFYFPTQGAQIYSEVSLAHDIKNNTLNPILYFKVKTATSLNKKMTLLMNAYGRSLLNQTTPVFLDNFLASEEYEISSYHHLPFYGLPTVWHTDRTAWIGALRFRYQFVKNNYITLSGNYMLHNDKIEEFANYKGTWGVGFSYAYKSIAGPIEFTLGYSNAYGEIVPTGNIGFWF